MAKIWKNARGVLRLSLLCLMIVVVAAVSEDADLDSVNVTSSGGAWVTTMDIDELEEKEKDTLVEQAEVGQEFSSMESILHWAIGTHLFCSFILGPFL